MLDVITDVMFDFISDNWQISIHFFIAINFCNAKKMISELQYVYHRQSLWN